MIVLPYRNPLVTAKTAATVDRSRPPFIFGVGVGWDEAEYKDLRLPFRRRRDRREYLAIIKAAWAADVPTYTRRYLTFGGAT